MSEATKPVGGYGDTDWEDFTNNWFASDAEWIQSRSVIRISGSIPTEGEVPAASNAVGRVFFSNSLQSLLINVTGGYHRVASSHNIGITDTGTNAELKLITGAGGTGISFSTSGVGLGSTTVSTLTVTGATTLNGYLTAKAGEATGAVVTTSSSGVTINTTGSNPVILTTASNGLNVNSSIRITGSGALSVAGNTALTGTLGVSGASTLAGLSATSSAVSGNSTVGGTFTSTGLVTANSGVSTTTVTASGLIESAGLTTSGVITSTSGTDVRLAIPAGRTLRIYAPTIADANIYYGSANNIRNAWVVYGTDPGVANVPEGTIWIT